MSGGKRTVGRNTKIWQLAQSSATKAEYLENDFTDATRKVPEFGWTEGTHAFQVLAGKGRWSRLVRYFTPTCFTCSSLAFHDETVPDKCG